MSGISKLFLSGVLGLAVCCAQSRAQGQPQDTAAHARAAQAAQRAGDFATAIKEYTILTHLEPEVAEVYSNLGIAYYFHKQPQQALQAFANALRLKPDLASALIFSGLAHYDLSDIPQALKALDRAVAIAPADPLAQTWLGYSYLAASRCEEAMDHFLIASRLQPNNPDVWYGLGHAYMEMGQVEIHKLVQVAPDGARLWELAGDQWRLRGDPGKAEAFYREALQRSPELAEVRESLAEVIAQQRNFAELPLPPPAPANPTESDRAADRYYSLSRDYERRAQAAFARIGAVASDSYRAHQVLAESLAAQQRFDEAIAEYRKILQLKPDLSSVHMMIGDLLMSQGRVNEAVAEYQAEFQERPKSPQVLYRLGRAWLVLHEDERAVKAFQEALVLHATNPEIQRELGKIYLRQQQYARSIVVLEAYCRIRPEDASAHLALMRVYESVGNASAASREQRLFEKYSEDAKRRTQAEQAIQFFEQQKEALP
ncbi:MAG: tetratricopeptide repeat protein [Acidobacteriia bacterium]|nr:tetratricopeptide repeat protein [Terriglobia bacterium]